MPLLRAVSICADALTDCCHLCREAVWPGEAESCICQPAAEERQPQLQQQAGGSVLDQRRLSLLARQRQQQRHMLRTVTLYSATLTAVCTNCLLLILKKLGSEQDVPKLW